MLRRVLVIVALVILILPNRSFALGEDLNGKLSKWSKKQKGKLGISLIDVDSGSSIYKLNDNQNFKPASVLKLLTGYAAYEILGLHYRFVTEVLTRGRSSTSIKELIVRGGADPSFTTEVAWMLARDVKRRGIRKVDKIVIDISRVRAAAPRSGQRAYEAGSSALPLNFNSLFFEVCPTSKGSSAHIKHDPYEFPLKLKGGIKTAASGKNTYYIDELSPNVYQAKGSIRRSQGCEKIYRSIAEPTSYLGKVLLGLFKKEGISVANGFSVQSSPQMGEFFTQIQSKPLSIILRDLNHYSTNFTAEQILLALSMNSNGMMHRDEGLRIIKKSVSTFKGGKDLILHDASGLSHDNRMQPRLLTDLLSWASGEPGFFSALTFSLPQYGKSGTLRKRSGVSTSNIFAKTGSINGVRTLSGYIYNRNKRLMAFALLQNNVVSSANAKYQEDKFLEIVSTSRF